MLSAACLPKASLRKRIDYRSLQKSYLSFLLSKTASVKALEKCDRCPRQLGSSRDSGSGRSKVKDGEEDLHLQSVLLRVR